MKHFSDTYNRWLLSGKSDRVYESDLMQYRQTWGVGDADDRGAILNWILYRRDADGFDLIVDSITDTDQDLAFHAVAIALALISGGYDLGKECQSGLEEFGTMYPERASLSEAALELLKER